MTTDFFKKTFRGLVMAAYGLEQKLFGGLGLGRIPVLRKLKQAVFSSVQPDFAEVDGLKIYLDPAYGFLDPERYKKSVADILKRELQAGNIVLDIGANIGYFTCLAARLVGEKGKVFAFEPDPKNLALLNKNISANGLKNVVVVPKAVSDKPEKLKFFVSGAHSSLGYSAVHSGESLTVEAVSIDEFFGDFMPKVDMVKMDVIGSEAKVLDGMKSLLLENKNVKLLSAFCPAFLRGAGSDPSRHLNKLFDLGFKIYNVTSGETHPIGRSQILEVIVKYSPSRGIAQGELFCIR